VKIEIITSEVMTNDLDFFQHTLTEVPLDQSMLKKGDALVSIDGFPLFNVPFPIVKSLLSGPPYSIVTLGFIVGKHVPAAKVFEHELVICV
jgi:hypothetical protein